MLLNNEEHTNLPLTDDTTVQATDKRYIVIHIGLHTVIATQEQITLEETNYLD